MRMSRLMSHTRREAPSESDQVSYQLLVRAGFIQPLAGGIFGLLPLGERTVQNMVSFARRELNALEAQEINLPLVQPAELWHGYGLPVSRMCEPGGSEMVLASYYEPALLELVRAQVKSYRQLPLLLYHQAALWRGTAPGRVGLLRGRYVHAIEAFSLHSDARALEIFYEKLNASFERFFAVCGIPVLRAASNPGPLGGTTAHEWLYLARGGDTTVLRCPRCGYTATQEAADFRRQAAPAEALLPLEKVATPHCATIESLADFLKVPTSRTAKAVFLVARRYQAESAPQEDLIFAVVRGDRSVNEAALLRLVGAQELRPAEVAEISAAGAAAGYASPVGLVGVRVIVDEQILVSPNLVSGANEAGYHLLNVNYGRDYQAALVAKLALAQAGDLCPVCADSQLESVEGYVLGQALQPDVAFTARRGIQFTGEDGQAQPVQLASYHIELSRLLACLAEAHNDEHGLRWPAAIAPYPVHLVILDGRKSDEPQAAGRELAARLAAEGFEPLVDDRSDSPGVKFMDADLIGLPVRLTVSERSLRQGGVEIKLRRHSEGETVGLDQVVAYVRDYLGREGLPV